MKNYFDNLNCHTYQKCHKPGLVAWLAIVNATFVTMLLISLTICSPVKATVIELTGFSARRSAQSFLVF